MSSPRKIRVAVVFGGRSSEHAISCVSAGSVLAALDQREYEVVPVGITKKGRWVLASADGTDMTIRDGRLPEITDRSGRGVLLAPDPTVGATIPAQPRAAAAAGGAAGVPAPRAASAAESVDSALGAAATGHAGGAVAVVQAPDGVRVLSDVDVVFPVLHGTYGEDGTIQGLFEMAGLPYVGAGVFASAAGMDKEFTKKLAAAEGIPVGPYAVLRGDEELSAADRERLGLPVFVKPSRAGSSIGITKVSDWGDLDAALAIARKIDSKVLVEAGIVGREVECGVLEGVDGGRAQASVPAEIRVVRGHDFYDFEAKYLDSDDVCEFDLPAKLPPAVIERVQRYAVRTFEALDCASLARVDFFVTPELDVYLNEINTMPGFTPISMFPRMWAASGVEYGALVDRLIRTAIRRGTGQR